MSTRALALAVVVLGLWLIGSTGLFAAEQYRHKPGHMFPNQYDSLDGNRCDQVPPDWFHLLSIPFQTTDRVLRVYCPQPCFVDTTVGDWRGFGYQFIDRCRNNGICLAVHDPTTSRSEYLGLIRMQHGSNHGGIVVPMALAPDDHTIILRAWIASPGARGGLVDYGYALTPVRTVTEDTCQLPLTRLAPAGVILYDSFGKAIYLDNYDNMPPYTQPGPTHNSWALFFRDLVADTTAKILEENNTTYELTGVDTANGIIQLRAIHYVFDDGCPKDEMGYFCTQKSTEPLTVPLPR